MSDLPRPQLRDDGWREWLDWLPANPAGDAIELSLAEWDLRHALTRLPETQHLAESDRALIRDWIADYRAELGRRQRESVPIVEANDAANIATIAIGLATAKLVPPLTIGAMIVSGILWARKIWKANDRRRRQSLTERIDQHLQVIDRHIR